MCNTDIIHLSHKVNPHAVLGLSPLITSIVMLPIFALYADTVVCMLSASEPCVRFTCYDFRSNTSNSAWCIAASNACCLHRRATSYVASPDSWAGIVSKGMYPITSWSTAMRTRMLRGITFTCCWTATLRHNQHVCLL